MRFTKMNGAGNDFILVENLHGELSEKLDALWDDVLALQKNDPVQVSDKPAEPKPDTDSEASE